MELTTIIVAVSGVFVSIGTFAAGVLTERRKNRALAHAQELANVDTQISIYQRMMADQQKHIEELRQMNHDLLATVQPLRDRVTHLEEEVRRLDSENKALKSKQ